MSLIICNLWWIALGALGGWGASWALGRPVSGGPSDHAPADAAPVAAGEAEVETQREAAAAVAPSVAEPPPVRPTPPVEAESPTDADDGRRAAYDAEIVRLRTVAAAREDEAKDLRAQLLQRDAELHRLRERRAPLAFAADAPKAAGLAPRAPDDFEIIHGVGPKVADILRAAGVGAFADLAATSPATLRAILERAGAEARQADLASWREQADLAARGQWRALAALQKRLDENRR